VRYVRRRWTTGWGQRIVVEESEGSPTSFGDRLRRGLRSHPNWGRYRSRVAALFGIAGLAVTQPLLDLVGRNPTFFVAGRYPSGKIVAFAVLVALVPASIGAAMVGVATRAYRRAGSLLYVATLCVLGVLFGLSVSRAAGADGLAAAGVIAVVVGGVVALLDRRFHAARQFLAYLALGNVAFVVLFLFASPTAELVAGASPSADWGDVEAPPLDGPVVVLVLDEFPLTSLLRPDGSIDATRFPRFAELAASSTWFRNASTESTETHVAVPSILSGRRGETGDLPNYRDYPHNIMTLFGDRYPLHRYQTLTELCPPHVCDEAPPGRLSQAVEDASIAFGHRVLPEPLRDRLPAIDQSWGGFGDESSADREPSQTFDEYVAENMSEWAARDSGPVAGLRGVTASIGAEPSINVMHLLLPHNPWKLTPSVAETNRPVFPRDVPDDPGDPAYDRSYRRLYQAHLLQVGAVDSLVGEVVDHLRAVGAWEDALLVVVADHGVDITPPGVGREVSAETQDEVLRVPLFIKAPGQADGEVRDDPATTLDVMPSIVDLLDVRVDHRFDGHSLFDDSEPPDDRLLTSDVDAALEVAARRAEQFPHGEGWIGLAAVGVDGDLVGRRVDELVVGRSSDLSWSLDERDALRDVSTTTGPVPLLIGGTVRGTSDTPPELVVAVNGTLAGTIGGYVPGDGGWRFDGLLAPILVDGANDVVAYEVERGSGGVVLHPIG
jgi:hypothetical protein